MESGYLANTYLEEYNRYGRCIRHLVRLAEINQQTGSSFHDDLDERVLIQYGAFQIYASITAHHFIIGMVTTNISMEDKNQIFDMILDGTPLKNTFYGSQSETRETVDCVLYPDYETLWQKCQKSVWMTFHK